MKTICYPSSFGIEDRNYTVRINHGAFDKTDSNKEDNNNIEAEPSLTLILSSKQTGILFHYHC